MTNDKFKSIVEPFETRRTTELPQVAAILDDFSNQSFSDSANIWRIFPSTGCVDLGLIQPDLLLVESAWAGNFDTWKYKITHGKRPSSDLIELVDRARELAIPTVFWNKEDPPHFEDFVETANLFEYIFTTEEAVIPRYSTETSAKKVDLLRFAANPVIHNPRRVLDYRQGDICFAGMFFHHKYPERREQMMTLFPPATRYNFEIYSRHAGGDPRYQFPDPFEALVVGKLPYSQMVEAYRKYKVFLNVNSVPNSRSMCARRVYELSAAKTAVVGMESEAIRSIYSENEVLLAQNAAEVEDIYRTLLEDDTERRKITQRAWRRTLSSHTYDHRMRQILEIAGFAPAEEKCKIYVVVEDAESAGQLLDDIAAQEFTLESEVQVQVIDSGAAKSVDVVDLKNCHVAVMKSGYRYGRFYLNDLVLTLKQQRSDFACKAPIWDPNVEAIEEDFITALPDYGWIAAPGRVQRIREVSEPLSLVTTSCTVYMGDPCGIARANTETVLLNV